MAPADDRRPRKVLSSQGQVVLAIDGLQSDGGQEVLWVIRDVLSSEVLRARSLLSARQQDLAELLIAVKASCPVPVAGVVSDGRHSIRKAAAQALPGVPYRLCRFCDLREAVRPTEEADRYHERHATGRKGASPAPVPPGAAGLAARSREVTAAEPAGADRGAWTQLRSELEPRRERRVERWQFRRDPGGCL